MAAKIDDILRHAMEARASDVHFSANEPIRMRVDGDLTNLTEETYSSDELYALFSEIMSDPDRDKLSGNKNLDKSYQVPGLANFRVNIFYTKRGFASVIRSIPSKIPTMDQLGLPESVRGLADLTKGLVLVTGPTGSGKSTTLAALLNHINVTYPYHILTVEDPVEFVHEPKMSLVNQREIGESCHTFADALKYALREDPDVILVGEMRDLETIALAMTAAETGHLVFGTLHTRGAAPSIDRIIDSFPSNQQAMVRAMLAESLSAVVSQALLKRKDGKGRVAAYEIMIVNHAISNLVREGKTFQINSAIQTARKDGMLLMTQHLKELIAQGVISEEEAAPYLEDGGAAKTAKPATAGAPAAKAAPAPAKPAPAKMTGKVTAGTPATVPTPAPAPKAATAAPAPAPVPKPAPAPAPAKPTAPPPAAAKPSAPPPPAAKPAAPPAPSPKAISMPPVAAAKPAAVPPPPAAKPAAPPAPAAKGAMPPPPPPTGKAASAPPPPPPPAPPEPVAPIETDDVDLPQAEMSSEVVDDLSVNLGNEDWGNVSIEELSGVSEIDAGGEVSDSADDSEELNLDMDEDVKKAG